MSTFYVHLLNPDAQPVGQTGNFTGVVTAPEANLLTLDINIPLASIKSHFKFMCASVGDVSDDGSVDSIDITGVVGVANATAAAWTFPAAGVAAANNMRNDFVSSLSQKVFGSRDAADLFSNRSDVETSWHTASAVALVSLKAKTYSAGINASKELIDAMFHTNHGKGHRFSMAYNAATDVPITPAAAASAVSVAGDSGSGAVVDVTTSGISVTTTGSGYVAGGVVTIGAIPSFTINSVQAAMLNGTLSSATEVPLRAGDKIRVIYEIDSNAGQQDASADVVSVAQRFNVDYALTA